MLLKLSDLYALLYMPCIPTRYLTNDNNEKWFYPLLITIFQVNMKSLSEAAGLQAGDTILAVNGKDLTSLRHKEAQEAIVKSGNNFSLTIVR